MTRPRVVLVYPRTGMDVPGKTVSLPLSVLHPAALLDAYGFEVRIVDQRVEPDWRGALRDALRHDPVCVGISSMTGDQIAHGIDAARLVKQHSAAPVVWGGVHPSLTPHQTIRSPHVDIVVVGEGERTLPELASALHEGRSLERVSGLCYRDGDEVRVTPERPPEDLDALPPVPYHLVDVGRYFFEFNLPGRTLSLLGGRGCPHRCGFCYNTRLHAHRWRGRDPALVVADIRKLRSLGAENVFVVDDDFFANPRRAGKICELLLAEKLHVPIITTCRADYLAGFSDDFLRLLGRCRFYVSIGVESGSPRILELIEKRITVEQVLRANRRLRGSGVTFNFAFMAGFPTETWEDIDQTVDLMVRLQDENPEARLTNLKIFTPLPGTALLKRCVQHGFEPPRDLDGWSRYSHHHANFRWGSARDAALLEKVSWFTYFLDGEQMQTMFGTDPLRRALFAAYSRLVRFRCRRHWYRFTPEVDLLRLAVERGHVS
jgi:radical SAM superfamily enzyme YgiQ (UPF0313 family)